jgi:ubiquitin-like protein Pup
MVVGESTRGAPMAESEHSVRRTRRTEDSDTEEEPVAADTTHKAELDSEVDSLLDEIDGVLEVNAEEFVRSFVQKGGQ